VQNLTGYLETIIAYQCLIMNWHQKHHYPLREMGNADEPVFFHVPNNITTDTKGSIPVTVKTVVHDKLIITVMFSVLADGRKLAYRGSVA
jgi:predicted PurR-regulated permease PerM